MQYRTLGHSGMKVSRLCLGTWNFGSYTDEQTACRIMDAALDAGINFFDTANHYPDFVSCGLTETIIGRWFSQGGSRRERVVLATKVYQPMQDTLDGPNNEPGLSLYKIRRHIQGSLNRLQTDHIELYQMHHIDRRADWMEVWEAFESLVRQGTVDYIGSSNFAGWHLAVAQSAARQRQYMGLVSEQHRYNLLCRLPELEVFPAARHHQIGIIVYSPLECGLLGGHALNPRAGSRTALRPAMVLQHRDQLEQFADLCRELGESQANVALAWVLAQPGVDAVILGPRTIEQFTSALPAADIHLTDESLRRLDQIFPGPGGAAPEAYAW